MTEPEPYTQPAVAGSGTIACGLAASASVLGQCPDAGPQRRLGVAGRGERTGRVRKGRGRDAGADQGHDGRRRSLRVRHRRRGDGGGARRQGRAAGLLGDACPKADLATTTSSLSIAELAGRTGRPTGCTGSTSSTPSRGWSWSSCACRTGCAQGVGERALAWCSALGKTAIEVPDQPGFVVNRLLFPYLFDAVRLPSEPGWSAPRSTPA